MKLLALVKAPADAAAAAQTLATQAGLTLAEARMRLAAEPPALLARLPEATADALARSLCASGLQVLAVEELAPPRLNARRFEIGERARFTDREGQALALHPGEVLAILRGLSAVREATEQTVKGRSLALGTAVLTGGLKLTKTTEKTVRSQAEQTEQAVWVLGRAGEVAVLRESVVDFTCLGSAMQPGRTANMLALAASLRAFAPAAFYDERLVRLGRRTLPFVLGEARVQGEGVATTRQSTGAGLELLVEVLRRALLSGMLP